MIYIPPEILQTCKIFFNPHTLRLTLCAVEFYVFWQTQCQETQLQYHTEWFHHHYSLYFTYSNFLPPKTPVVTDLFIVYLVLSFQNVSEVMEYIALSDWLLSLRNMQLILIHILYDLISHSFLLPNCTSLYVHTQFVYPFTYWRTSWLFAGFVD